MNAEKIRINFENDLDLNVNELSEYIALLNTVVEALENRFPDYAKMEKLKADDASTALETLKSLTPIEWSDYVSDAKGSNIGVTSLVKNSPLEVTLCGCLVMLTLALVFSGGEVTFSKEKGVKVKLPSLGVGLKSLRKALAIGEKFDLAYGIQRVTIKLNKQEMELLMQQDPSTAKKGGFQNYLIGLQFRANRIKREIVLDQQDIEKIKKLKSNPQRGGFQSRFNKILVLRGFWWDFDQAIETSSLPRKNSTRMRNVSKERKPLALATTLATREFMPSDIALVMRCLR